MKFSIAKSSAFTGAILERLVREELESSNVPVPQNAIICYGLGTGTGMHTLNGLCSTLDKMQQGQQLYKAMPKESLAILTTEEEALGGGLPLLARKRQHSKGKDIMPVLEGWQVPARIAAGANFFTPYIPSVREYRVWIYRSRHLGTYEKVLTEPEVCIKLGRNRANGFTFSFRESATIPETLKDVARRAITALSLDFGAVDVLETAQGNFIVLEVNSAPGVQDEHRRVIQTLAHRIVRWIANGCPGRRDGTQ